MQPQQVCKSVKDGCQLATRHAGVSGKASLAGMARPKSEDGRGYQRVDRRARAYGASLGAFETWQEGRGPRYIQSTDRRRLERRFQRGRSELALRTNGRTLRRCH